MATFKAGKSPEGAAIVGEADELVVELVVESEDCATT